LEAANNKNHVTDQSLWALIQDLNLKSIHSECECTISWFIPCFVSEHQHVHLPKKEDSVSRLTDQQTDVLIIEMQQTDVTDATGNRNDANLPLFPSALGDRLFIVINSFAPSIVQMTGKHGENAIPYPGRPSA
jgi:hypothetical protein